jgi:hypothetical protein
VGVLMKYLLFLITLLGLASPHSKGANSIVVVANTQDTSITLSRQEIRNLFMGGVLSYDLRAIALPPENQTRVLFNTKVVGLTESRIQSYWAQMRFTGRKTPPKELSSETLIIEYLQGHPGTVAYLPAEAEIPSGLTVLFQIH